jgi:hypothetical protein
LKVAFGVVDTARAMLPLAYWTKVKSEFLLFRAVAAETQYLPVGDVRAYWAKDSLEREDIRIDAAEKIWREQALSAAARPVEKYKWTIRQTDSSTRDD